MFAILYILTVLIATVVYCNRTKEYDPNFSAKDFLICLLFAFAWPVFEIVRFLLRKGI